VAGIHLTEFHYSCETLDYDKELTYKSIIAFFRAMVNSLMQ